MLVYSTTTTSSRIDKDYYKVIHSPGVRTIKNVNDRKNSKQANVKKVKKNNQQFRNNCLNELNVKLYGFLRLSQEIWLQT